METLDECHILTALHEAAHSPCRSKRGVAIFDPTTGAHRGAGFNGLPPIGTGCPGRAICAGTCGQRAVHAEVRALREAVRNYGYPGYPSQGAFDLVHVELAEDGTVVACDGPNCPGCAAQILDVGFIGGVWLFELPATPTECRCGGTFSRAHNPARGCPVHSTFAREMHDRAGSAWRRYTAEEFHRRTLERCGMVTP